MCFALLQLTPSLPSPSFRRWHGHDPHRLLGGHLLQYDHCLRSLLPLRIPHKRLALAALWQLVEHRAVPGPSRHQGGEQLPPRQYQQHRQPQRGVLEVTRSARPACGAWLVSRQGEDGDRMRDEGSAHLTAQMLQVSLVTGGVGAVMGSCAQLWVTTQFSHWDVGGVHVLVLLCWPGDMLD